MNFYLPFKEHKHNYLILKTRATQFYKSIILEEQSHNWYFKLPSSHAPKSLLCISVKRENCREYLIKSHIGMSTYIPPTIYIQLRNSKITLRPDSKKSCVSFFVVMDMILSAVKWGDCFQFSFAGSGIESSIEAWLREIGFKCHS